MIVAIDSSVLFTIFKNEPHGAEWLDYLLRLRLETQLVACDVVWAEVAPLFDDVKVLRAHMLGLDVRFSPLDDRAAFVAGQLFARYRTSGGVRNRMVPDFMIAAHALQNAAGLATADGGYMRDHFSKLKIFSP
jgi:predicted nucleic acid-binding protein